CTTPPGTWTVKTSPSFRPSPGGRGGRCGPPPPLNGPGRRHGGSRPVHKGQWPPLSRSHPRPSGWSPTPERPVSPRTSTSPKGLWLPPARRRSWPRRAPEGPWGRVSPALGPRRRPRSSSHRPQFAPGHGQLQLLTRADLAGLPDHAAVRAPDYGEPPGHHVLGREGLGPGGPRRQATAAVVVPGGQGRQPVAGGQLAAGLGGGRAGPGPPERPGRALKALARPPRPRGQSAPDL